MRKSLVLAAVAALAALALIGAGVYVYFYSGLLTTPPRLGLSSPSPASLSSSSPGVSLAGSWTVVPGSVAGYRAEELFVGQTTKQEAVARTSDVSGGVTVSAGSGGYQLSKIVFAVGLAGLHSIDTVAGRDVTQRDPLVAQQLDVKDFPDATFTSASASAPRDIGSAAVVVPVSGLLTIRGESEDLLVMAKVRLVADRIEVAGNVAIDMSDYLVSPPQVPFVSVDAALLIEFDIFLARSS